MTFDDITGDGRLWAVRYDGDNDNILALTFDRWYDLDWLKEFFIANKKLKLKGADNLHMRFPLL